MRLSDALFAYCVVVTAICLVPVVVIMIITWRQSK